MTPGRTGVISELWESGTSHGNQRTSLGRRGFDEESPRSFKTITGSLQPEERRHLWKELNLLNKVLPTVGLAPAP